MNKRICGKTMFDQLIRGAALATICGAAAFAPPVLAQRATQAGTTANARADHAHVNSNAKAATRRTVPPLTSRQCIRETGSHIPPPKGQCLPVAGNSYSQQDIRRTGATNVGQALQMLDPSVTVHGH